MVQRNQHRIVYYMLLLFTRPTIPRHDAYRHQPHK